MPTPSTRTPVRIARGTYSNLNGSKADILEGEVCYATDENNLYVKEGSNLEKIQATTFTGDLTLNAQADVRWADADSSNYIAVQAPGTVGSNVTFTLPATDGSSGQYLKTDGSGALGWGTDNTTDTTKMPLAGGTFTGDVNIDNQKDLRFEEATANGDNYVA